MLKNIVSGKVSMGKIRQLDEGVYKKIAAGEVVERPVSVVKELVENAIDAGASRIAVSLRAGGKEQIRVEDDGEGFSPEDIEPAFRRHSTSKLTLLEDLDRLQTLGFRGEALPAILEVSQVEVRTADNSDGAGVRVVFRDGEQVAREEIACNRGAVVEVNDLFYNFPVRRKFLKSDRTELGRIVDFLQQLALAHHPIAFSLENNGKTVFSYDRTASLSERVYQVLGKETLDRLQEVDFSPFPYRVQGLVSKVNTGIPRKKHQYFFINRRLVREKTLFAALNRTFEKYLEKHHHPVAVLTVDFPPSEVDVNIHPMKLEIRFKDSGSVFRLIRDAITASLAPLAHIPSAAQDGGRHVDLSAPPPAFEFAQGAAAEPALFTPVESEEDFRIIGQFQDSYILAEKEGELLIIDQHNAHERINYDRLKQGYEDHDVVSITPLFPLVLDLTPSEHARLDSEKQAVLERMGFELAPLSGTSFDVKRFPQVLHEKRVAEAVSAVLDRGEGEVAFEDRVLAQVACKSAVKVNHRLHAEEMRVIVRDLFATSNPYICPHRRPIVVNIGLEEIEKRMRRR